MKVKLLRALAAAILLAGASLAGASIAQAGTIHVTDVVVSIHPTGAPATTGNAFCAVQTALICDNGPAGFTPHKIWSFPVGGQALLDNTGGLGQSILLAQTGGAFNFDTSDFCGPAGSCDTALIKIVTTELGTLSFTEGLSRFITCPAGCGGDALSSPPLETAGYSSNGNALVELLVGYADDAHLQSPHTACTDPGANCRPDPFSATFQQNAAATGGCLGSVDPCYDSGVLRIRNLMVTVSVPEPATLFLLGSGFLGLAAWGRRRMRS